MRQTQPNKVPSLPPKKPSLNDRNTRDEDYDSYRDPPSKNNMRRSNREDDYDDVPRGQ
jgi:hypothetical protein